MLLFEYHCETCGRVFEQRVPYSDVNRRQECPFCHGQDTRRLIPRLSDAGFAGSETGSAPVASCSSPGGRFT